MTPAPSRTRQWLPYTAAVTAGLLVIAGAFVLVRQRDAGTDRPRADCATNLDVNSSTEKAALLVELAKRYNSSDRSLDGGGCAQVRVSALNSGKATEALAAGWSGTGLPEPQVWLPTSSLWTGQLQLLDQAAGRASVGRNGVASPSARTTRTSPPRAWRRPSPRTTPRRTAPAT
ncbi:hypothetical protein ACSNOB_02925 [Micromonospora sp. URMC 106]|uniref:hypothetical protein n=1 Tax=Micromonospora sp. URMC 106 TaxID=3423408 RepID=UPI003F1BDEBD